jgi:hypothetical protein
MALISARGWWAWACDFSPGPFYLKFSSDRARQVKTLPVAIELAHEATREQTLVKFRAREQDLN